MQPLYAPQIQLCTYEDLDEVLRLQDTCYAEHLREDKSAFAAKLTSSPATCWNIPIHNEIAAYLFALPCTLETLPLLNDATVCSISTPSILYIHDLAVSPQMKGRRLGDALVEHALAFARGPLGLSEAYLVAVQNSETYWARFGFQQVENISPEFAHKLASYGDGARLMRRSLEDRPQGIEELVLPKQPG